MSEDNTYDKYLFYAKTTEGSIVKGLVDTLQKKLSKIELRLTKQGIYSKVSNGKERNNILFNIGLLRDNFNEYHCEFENNCIGLNSEHTQDQTYSVKRKQTVVMYIEKSSPEKFMIKIIPQINGDQRCKVGFVIIQKVQNKDIAIEDRYNNPILIEPIDFQRVCKDISRTHSKKIILDVGKGWVRFSGESREITGCSFNFGINFDKIAEGYVSINYIGGKEYEKKSTQAVEL